MAITIRSFHGPNERGVSKAAVQTLLSRMVHALQDCSFAHDCAGITSSRAHVTHSTAHGLAQVVIKSECFFSSALPRTPESCRESQSIELPNARALELPNSRTPELSNCRSHSNSSDLPNSPNVSNSLKFCRTLTNSLELFRTLSNSFELRTLSQILCYALEG